MHGKAATAIPLLLLAIGTLLSCYVFIAPGHPVTVDAWPHLSRTKMVYEAIRDGHSPFWSFMFYSGYPALRFYSPLLYFAGGFVALGTRGDVLLALRVLLISLQVLSVLAMFAFVRRRTGDIQAAALGSLVYVIVPWRAFYLGGLANYPQALVYLWLPLMFFFLDRFMFRHGRRDALMLGLVATLGMLSHVIYAAVAVGFLCLMLLLAYPRSGPGSEPRAPVGRLFFFAGLTTLALGAFFLVPFLAEYRSHVFPIPMTTPWAAPALRAVLGFVPVMESGYGRYLGLSVLALLLPAIVMLGRSPCRRYALSLSICLVVVLLYVFILPLLGAFGAMLTLNLPSERFVVFFVFFAAVLIGLAWPVWRARVRLVSRYPLAVFVVLIASIMLDCLGRNLLKYDQPRERFLGARPGAYAHIAGEDHARILDLTNCSDRIDDFMRTEAYPSIGFIFGSLPTPLGPFYHQFAPRSMLYCYPWIGAISAGLGDPTAGVVPDPARKALALMGVSHVIAHFDSELCPQPGPFPDSGPLMRDGFRWDRLFVNPGRKSCLAVGATGFGMALASSRICPMAAGQVVHERTMPTADNWLALLDSVLVCDSGLRLSCIPVDIGDRAESLPGRPELRVITSLVRHQDVTLKLVASHDCFLRLAVSYYPGLRVTVDDEEVEFRETMDHFIHLRLPEGMHTVRVTAPLTPIRRVSLAASALSVVLLAIGLVLPGRRKGRALP